MNTPGVYIKELTTLANSVAGVSTAIPLFIGFTEKNGNKRAKITSMLEFTETFGNALRPDFEVIFNNKGETTEVLPSKRFFLYDCLSLYFQNGGGPCYIQSAGGFDASDVHASLSATVNVLELDEFKEATIVCMPDLHAQHTVREAKKDPKRATVLTTAQFGTLVSSLINKCQEVKGKFLLTDALQVGENVSADGTLIRQLINPTSAENLKHSACYYPWINAVTAPTIDYNQINVAAGLQNDPAVQNRNKLKEELAKQAAHFPEKAVSVAEIQKVFESKKTAFSQATTEKAGKQTLSNLFKFLYELINGLYLTETNDKIATLQQWVKTVKADKTVIAQIEKLLSFKGVCDRESGLTDATTSSINDAAYGWFSQNPSSSSPPSVKTIEDNAALSGYNPDFTSVGNGAKEKRNKVLQDLESGKFVNLSVIFAGVASIYESGSFNLREIEQYVLKANPIYRNAQVAIVRFMQQQPSIGAVAGLYAQNDRTKGVWSSPANLSLAGVKGPVVSVSRSEQDALNVDPGTGKSINVIRDFTGKGTLVWGARTMAGNSNEWRYISVRRYFDFAEKSIEEAIAPFLFSPNNPQTWVRTKAMITSFLIQQWQQGALVGETHEEAFFVNVGLGETMSEQDIQAGKMNINIGMAVSRPAEFIIIQFSHYLKS